MELRKEFHDIYDKKLRALNGNYLNRSEALYEAVKDCQKLADRPPRELTDAEIEKIIVDTRALSMQGTCRAIEAAAHAKQREPQVVKFRAARRKSDGIVQLIPASTGVNHLWEWLDADGKAQIYEVKV